MSPPSSSASAKAGPAVQPQHSSPHFISVFPETFSPELCREVIHRFEADSRAFPSATATRSAPKVRSGTMLDLAQHREWADICTQYHQATERNLQAYGAAVPSFTGFLSSPGVTRGTPVMERIEPGQGFDMHVDASFGGTHRRLLACLLYLNDVAEGGFTEFPFQRIRVQPKAGSMVLFPPYWTHPHRGASPVSNVKYKISSYLLVDVDFNPYRGPAA